MKLALFSQMDSRSFMSTDFAPGASLATGFITLLGVANALGSLTTDEKAAMKQNVVFAVLDGVSS